MLQVNFSNRVETLFQQMKRGLFREGDSPFLKRLVIVPSPAMKAWIMLQLAKDEEVGIAAGLQFAYLESGLEEIKRHLSGNYRKKPGILEVSLKIEAEIRAVVEDPERDGDVWAPLFKYLNISNLKISRKSERRLVSLSSKLASLFDRYEVFGRAMEIKGWQGELWRRLGKKREEIGNLSRKNLQIELFSISFLPKKHHEFLKEVSKDHSVNYYVLSPCQAFWSDLLTDRESRRLKKYWEMQGGTEPQLIALEELLFDRNALLANFGRMGREMAELLEEAEKEEEYQVTKAVAGHEQYREFLFENVELNENPATLSLLEGVLADLLFLRNPDIQEKIDLPLDNSIQIHVASSKMREIQVLYDALMDVMRQGGISPGEIIVMAPDIAEYEPYIRAVFENKIDFQIMDLHLLTQHPLVQGFLHVLSLPFTRWDVSSVLQLLEFGSFRKKSGISSDEAGVIKSWVREAEVRWGADRVHREELLLKSHCFRGMADDTAIGTWEHGLERLLYGWMMHLTEDNEVNNQMEVIPVESVDLTQGELLGKWVELFQSLRNDLKPLIDGTRMKTSEWASYFKRIFEAYFACEGAEEEESKNHLMGTLQAFERIDNQATYSFISMRHHLVSALNSQRVCYREPHLQAIRFCSMLPMRALPAKAIALLGMEEGAFPRKDQTHSLNLMGKAPDVDYCPSQTDFDRYLFLEILLSVRKYLLISYVGYSKADSKEKPPSLLVTELMNYLDSAFTLNGKRPSECCVVKHPFKEFDKKYFDGTLKSYSFENYRAACAYYLHDKKKSHRFIAQFIAPEKTEPDREISLDLKALVSFARDPVGAYFKDTLGVYLDEEKKVKTEETFTLSGLEKGSMIKSTMKTSFPFVVDLAQKKGQLPLGIFGEIAIKDLREDADKLQNNLKKANVTPHEIFEIEFSDSTSTPKSVENGILRLPPLEINYKDLGKIKISGRLSHVVESGIIGYGDNKVEDAIKLWPEYLVYLCLREKYDLKLGNGLILAKSGSVKAPFFENPSWRLQQYLEYYLHSLETASPLIPKWVLSFIKDDFDKFEKKVKSDTSERSMHFYNDYMLHVAKDADTGVVFGQFPAWKNIAEKLYGELHENWF